MSSRYDEGVLSTDARRDGSPFKCGSHGKRRLCSECQACVAQGTQELEDDTEDSHEIPQNTYNRYGIFERMLQASSRKVVWTLTTEPNKVPHNVKT